MTEAQAQPLQAGDDTPLEANAKADRGEAIRAVRVIRKRISLAEIVAPVPPMLPRQGFAPRRSGEST